MLFFSATSPLDPTSFCDSYIITVSRENTAVFLEQYTSLAAWNYTRWLLETSDDWTSTSPGGLVTFACVFPRWQGFGRVFAMVVLLLVRVGKTLVEPLRRPVPTALFRVGQALAEPSRRSFLFLFPSW
jgi:hypothetical protein